MTTQQIEQVVAMPPVIPNHGWVPTPPSLNPFRQACLSIPDETMFFAWPGSIEEELHFFTDGSCLDPTSQLSKLTSWGVVLGLTHGDTFAPIANGLVPGWTQTAARAEILAVISACECASILKRPTYLWVDNNRVYNKLRSFQKGKHWIGPNQKDADLWGKLSDAVARLGSLLVSVTKVVSHQNLVGA